MHSCPVNVDWDWTGHYIIFVSLHFDLFCLSEMISIAKKDFFDVGQKLHLSMGIRVNILNVVGDYVGLVKWWLQVLQEPQPHWPQAGLPVPSVVSFLLCRP